MTVNITVQSILALMKTAGKLDCRFHMSDCTVPVA